MSPILWKKEAYKKGTLPPADAVNVARHALKKGQQAEPNVENSLLLPRKVLYTNGFRLSVHFYIILPATLHMLSYTRGWTRSVVAGASEIPPPPVRAR